MTKLACLLFKIRWLNIQMNQWKVSKKSKLFNQVSATLVLELEHFDMTYENEQVFIIFKIAEDENQLNQAIDLLDYNRHCNDEFKAYLGSRNLLTYLWLPIQLFLSKQDSLNIVWLISIPYQGHLAEVAINFINQLTVHLSLDFCLKVKKMEKQMEKDQTGQAIIQYLGTLGYSEQKAKDFTYNFKQTKQYRRLKQKIQKH